MSMDLMQPLHEGHKVLGDEDYCSGYMDPFGKWNNGFPCPVLEEGVPVYCCGTESLKYCCVHPKTPLPPPIPHLTLLLGVTFGIAVAVVVVVVVSCFHCSCCLLYKKRQPTREGSMYQMHCHSASTTGVANMYSFSGTSSPTETPRSTSRASSSSRSRITTTSGPSTISYAHYDLADLRIRSDLQGHTYSRVSGNSRPGSIAYSDRSTSTLSDVTVREVPSSERFRNSIGGLLSTSNFEPPPPYTSPQSTLVAVRTASRNPVSSTSVPEHNEPPSFVCRGAGVALSDQPSTLASSVSSFSNIEEQMVSETQMSSEPIISGSQLRTFSPTTAPSASSSAAIAALAVAARLPTVTPNIHSSQRTANFSQYSDYPFECDHSHYSNMRNGYANQIYENLNNQFNSLPGENELVNIHVYGDVHKATVHQSRNPTESLNHSVNPNSCCVICNISGIATPDSRPCNTGHAVNAQQGSEEYRLYSATKF